MRNALTDYPYVQPENSLSRPISTITGNAIPSYEERAQASIRIMEFLNKLGQLGKLQANRFIVEPAQTMSRIGNALRGNAPADLTYDQFADDARNALLTYNMPGMAFSGTNPTLLGALTGKGPGGKIESMTKKGGKANIPTVSPKAEGGIKEYPKVKDVVDGRLVHPDVPNMDSIGASLVDYEVLPGIREIPMSDFELTGRHYSVPGNERIRNLAEQIKASKEINPLIVVVDDEGPYILEGATRADALKRLDAKSFPAIVVIDREKLPDIPVSPKAEGGIKEQIKSFGDAVKKELGLKQFAVSQRDNNTIDLDLLVVDKAKQGQGLGTAAMDRLVDFADQNGLRIYVTLRSKMNFKELPQEEGS